MSQELRISICKYCHELFTTYKTTEFICEVCKGYGKPEDYREKTQKYNKINKDYNDPYEPEIRRLIRNGASINELSNIILKGFYAELNRKGEKYYD
jgi:hypothetical protein